METRAGRLLWRGPHLESLLGVHTQPEAVPRPLVPEKGTPPNPARNHPPRGRPASPSERGKAEFKLERPLRRVVESAARLLVEAALSLASRRSDWSRAVRPPSPPPLERAAVEEARWPGLREAGSGALPAPTKMVARFRSGSLSIGLSTDISAAAEQPDSAQRAAHSNPRESRLQGAGRGTLVRAGLSGSPLLKEPLPLCPLSRKRFIFNYVRIGGFGVPGTGFTGNSGAT